MEAIKWAEVCGPSLNGIYIARTEQGALFKGREEDWQPFDFNAEYGGYYPSCRFTKLVYLAEQFYLAGVDHQGNPRLFVSLMGSVWEERNINAFHPFGGTQPACGRIVEILFADTVQQIFLITDQGQLLVLPDCPKCVRIIPIAPEALGGYLEDGEIVVCYPDRKEQKVSVASAAQFRASMSHMRSRLNTGAILVDVRSEEFRTSTPIPDSLSVPVDDVSSWLQTQNAEQEMYFVCMYGVQSDRAAECARRMGFHHAYSVGGIKEIAHVQ